MPVKFEFLSKNHKGSISEISNVLFNNYVITFSIKYSFYNPKIHK